MKLTPASLRAFALWMAVGFGLLVAAPLHAQNFVVTCSVTGISNLAFGNVNPQASQTDTTATINFACNNPNHQFYNGVICFGATDAWAGSRQMSDGNGHNLAFQAYTDGTYSTPLGISPNTLNWPVSIPNDSPGWIGSATLYGRVANGQTGAVAGSYQYLFSGVQTTIAVNVSKNFTPTDCNGVAPAPTGTAFQATATVVNACSVAATTLDFGNPAGLLSANVDAASIVQVTCPTGTAYQIGLDNGLNASGATRRMAGGSAEFISYELYRDGNRTQRWGTALNSDTVAGTGNGLAQSATVYGRVAPQTTPSPSTYSDTITVTVTY